MDVRTLPLDGLLLLSPRVHRDARGFFLETFRADQFAEFVPGVAMVQDNHSRSLRDTVRGMHFQTGTGQAKLVRCSRGRVFDVAVDIRTDSPTFGRWHGEILDDVAHRMLFIPVGFAHGFCVLSDDADVSYKCSSIYNASTESGFAPYDPAVGIAWPVPLASATLSVRDQQARPLAGLPRDHLPTRRQ